MFPQALFTPCLQKQSWKNPPRIWDSRSGWKHFQRITDPSCLGLTPRIDRPTSKCQTFSIILKETDPKWSEEEIASELAQQINIQKDELTIKLFIKKDGKILNTIKAGFTTTEVQQRAIATGQFISNQFFRLKEIINEELSVTRCFKCQKFDHRSSSCKRTTKCRKCTQPHSTRDCQTPNNEAICAKGDENYRLAVVQSSYKLLTKFTKADLWHHRNQCRRN